MQQAEELETYLAESNDRVREQWGCLVFQAVDFADVLLERQALGSEREPLRLALLAVFTVAFVIGIRDDDRAFHGALAIAWLVVCVWWGATGLREPIFAL